MKRDERASGAGADAAVESGGETLRLPRAQVRTRMTALREAESCGK